MTGDRLMGLSWELNRLLGNLTLICAFSCLYLSIRPSSFCAEFFLSSGVLFKGTWALQIGLSLYTDTFGLKGCGRTWLAPIEGKSDVKCALDEDKFRAIALMNLLFIVHAIFVLIVGFGMYMVICYSRNLRSNEASGALLARLESESMQIQSLPESIII